MRTQLSEQASLFQVFAKVGQVAADHKLSPDDDAYWTLVPRPDENVVDNWLRLGLDKRLEAVLPDDHHHWSTEQKYTFVLRLTGMLVEDMMAVFAAHHERDKHGHLVFWKHDQEGNCVLDEHGNSSFDEEDCADFIATLGWVCGQWRGVVPFDFAMSLFGFNPKIIREATMEAYEQDLHLVQEVHRFGMMVEKIAVNISTTGRWGKSRLLDELAKVRHNWRGQLTFDLLMRISGFDAQTRKKVTEPRGPDLLTAAVAASGPSFH